MFFYMHFASEIVTDAGLTAANAKTAKAAAVAQSVEHVLGKDEVIGSIPICSSRKIGGLKWQRKTL